MQLITVFFVSIFHISDSYTWNTLSALPTSLGYSIGGIYENKIHILGGYDANGLQQNDYSATIQYNRSSNTINLSDWSVNSLSSSFPTITELGSDTQQYVHIDEFIYIMGTDDRIFLEDAPGKLIIYNMKTQQFKDTSTYSSSMILQRSGNCVTTDKIYLYSIGGHDSIGYATTDFIKYHIQNDKWSHGPSINYARYSAQCVLIVDELYVIGGSVVNMELLNINGNSNLWTVVGSIPHAITSSFAYNINSKGIYLAGGATSVIYGTSFSDAYLYNITDEEWTSQNSMVNAAYAFVSITYEPVLEWMFIIHLGGVSCQTEHYCFNPVYLPVIQYTKVPVKVMNSSIISTDDAFTTTHAVSDTTQFPKATTKTVTDIISTTVLSTNATARDMNSPNLGGNKDKTESNGILSVIIEHRWFYPSLIVIGLILIIIIFFVCICCKKKYKRIPTQTSDKTIPLSNPMIVLIGIGNYDANPPNSDLLDNTFIDLPIDVDIKNLISLFRHELGYDIYPQYDESIKTHWTQNELIELLNTQAQILENNRDKFDGLILVMSSHGIHNHIVTSDHQMIEKHVIHRIFSHEHPKSRNIPRIFLFDCCDGDEFSKGRRNKKQNDILISKQYGMKQLQSDSHKPSWEKGTQNPDHKLAVIHAANVGFRSNMNRSKGSFVIHKFVEKTKHSLTQYGEGRVLSELFDEIQQELGDTQLCVFMWNNGTGKVKLMIKDMDQHVQPNEQSVEMRQILKRNSNKINYQRV